MDKSNIVELNKVPKLKTLTLVAMIEYQIDVKSDDDGNIISCIKKHYTKKEILEDIHMFYKENFWFSEDHISLQLISIGKNLV